LTKRFANYLEVEPNSTGAGVVWLSGCILALGAAAFVMKIIFGRIAPVEFVSAWGLASVNAGLAVMINIIAMRKKSRDFVVWGAGGNVLRFIGVLVIVLIVKFQGRIKFEPFVTAFLAGYFVFMIAETIRMNVVNFRSMREK